MMTIKIHQHSQSLLQKWLSLLSLGFLFVYLPVSYADVGKAARYHTPYIPTACYGSGATPFPANNLFAAAGEGIWDNGAACGRQYLVRCISAPAPYKCDGTRTIQVKIVDRAATAKTHPSSNGAALVLSTAAFQQLVMPTSATFFNIEYKQI